MCGLFFVLQKGRPIDRERFVVALNTMQHRGPDHVGTRFITRTVEASGGPCEVHVAFGLHRLAILDLDPRSHQPYADDDRALVYNGEIYNYRELKGAGIVRDGNFRTTSDTEFLFKLLAQGNIQELGLLNGMWALCFFDGHACELTLSRDRYGKKPLFYFLDQDVLCVSSTIRAILEFLAISTTFERPALLAYLNSGVMYPGDGHATHLSRIRQLPPATVARFDIRRWTLQSERFFSFRSTECAPHPSDLAQTIADAVRIRLISDRPVGLLLSGGVDSSIVLAGLASQGLQHQVHCFIGEAGRSEDALYARKCTQQLGIDATVVEMVYTDRAFERFLRMCRHYEKPFPLLGNSMAMSQMYEAIQGLGVPVVLDGTGGDEIFGGYWNRQFPFAVRDALRTQDVRRLLKMSKSGRPFCEALGWTGARKRATQLLLRIPGIHHKSNAIRDYCSPEVIAAGSPDPLAAKYPSFREALCLDVERGRLGEWIWHNDRNAMMSSIENRSPLLDYRLARFIGTPASQKFVDRWNKHELRSAFDMLVKLPTQWRTEKQGFRWAARRFFKDNSDRILELIAASELLKHHVRIDRFCDDVRRGKRLMSSRLTPRLLCIAGVEHALRLRPE
ncbi:MAG: asparagine synthase (glutamine-hydrolyzing) [Hyphomicrobiaceae bacterium]